MQKFSNLNPMKENLFSLKLFTLLLISLLSLNFVSAQINISQNFNATSLPSGWVSSTPNPFAPQTLYACEGTHSVRALMNSTNVTKSLTSPNQVSASNGLAINVSFTYKVLTNANPAPINFGSIEVQYSTNSGANFTTAYTINNTNHVASTSCANVNFTLPSGVIPNGSSFQLRFLVNRENNIDFQPFIDQVLVVQTTNSVPNCNSTLSSPANGATNVPVTTNSISWTPATGIPTGYKLRVGTTPGGFNIINNIDVGNVTTYPISLVYNTTYYVGITPYNANGNATGCTEYSFKTVAPITTARPWNEGFSTTALPNGWTRTSGVVIGITPKLPGSDSNIIYRNLNASVSTANFSTISVGSIQSGDKLNFIYRLGNFSSPNDPPAAGTGNFIVAISTDYGINYSNVQTVNNNGTAGWQNYSLDLSAYAGNFVKIRITANRISGDYLIGFDDFYIGENITCATPEDLILNYAGDDSAQISWDTISNAASYNWYVFNSGANPETSTPLLTGTVTTPSVIVNGLAFSTDYDFYVETNCGIEDGLSNLSEVFSFTTACESINSFPFTETFEDNSNTRDCWAMEFVSGNTSWSLASGTGFNLTNAHSGALNALFTTGSFAIHKTKMVSPLMNTSNLNLPKLSFWYANEEGSEAGDLNELRIYYKNQLNGSWILIPGATYTTNVSSWTYVELDLPAAAQNYQIAFEGTNGYGYGIAVDDITISDSDACPVTTWDGLAWSNGTPDLSKKAVINGNLVLNSNLETCELEVAATGRLEIPSGFSFKVNGLITNHASAENFIVSSDANLIQVQDINNTGQITVLRESQPIKRLDYTMWSSPVTGQQLQAFSPMTLPNRISTYEGAAVYVTVPNPLVDFVSAKGYMFRAPNDWNSTTPTPYLGKFTGIPFNGTVNVATHTGSFTSVGNPYPSNINADDFMSANPGISTLYYWVNPPTAGQSGNNYATYTSIGGVAAGGGTHIPDEFISVGQGFLVQTTDASVEFDNSMRVTDDATFFKESLVDRHRYRLNFSEGTINYTQILVAYMAGATNGVDNQIDGKLFESNANAFYSVIDGGKYVIQGRALPFLTTDVVQMGYKVNNAGQFTVSIATLEGLFTQGQNIYIHDKYLHIVHNLNESNYTYSSEAGEFNDRFDVIYEESECPNSTIWDGLAWSNGLPDLNKKAIIDGELNLNSDLEACQIEVTQNGNLEITSGFTFTVNGSVTNLGSSESFTVANGGNLIQIENVENIGEITVIRESQPIVRLDYTMWSSPVFNQNLFGFSPETVNGVTNYPGSTGRIYIYDGANGYVNPNPFDADAIMETAIGYLFRSPNNWNSTNPQPYIGEFIGVANNGDISVSTSTTGTLTSIGNPYASNIDADLLMGANSGIAALYYWNNTGVAGSNYATYTMLGGTAAGGGSAIPDQYISVGQGFIVSSTDAVVNFDNTMRVGNPAQFFKIDELEKHRFWLSLNNSENHKYNQILVGYMSGATDGIDNQIDGKLFGYEGSALYSIVQEDNFAVQGRSLPFENSDVVALGFKAVEAGKFVISLNDFDGLFAEGNVKIYLKDNQTNLIHNLMETDYTFESEAGEFKSRFEIVYETEEVMGSDELTSHSIQIYKNNDNIVVSSKSEKILTVELFDMVGRNIFRNEKVNSNHYEFKSQFKGVLIIRVQSQNGKIISKKIINK